eukprot:TRINITY_DN19765_c0_g1_i1.p1 TRINITY_DN19765_c0_g1~~TRINITY_DN19765_c0_g1_i1.p1  ORF type:complete len:601 (+),score=123.18 TRINITY_DN19765_c0_g1_i1:44-1846(+)
MITKAYLLLLCFIGAALSDKVVFSSRKVAPHPWQITDHKLSGTEQLSFFIALPQQNLALLEEIYWDRTNPDSPNYQQWMSVEDLNEITATPGHVVGAVKKWLVSSGVEDMKFFGDSIEVTASVSVLRELFSTDFFVFSNNKGEKLIRQWGELSIPSELVGHIEMIVGLSSFPIPRSPYEKRINRRGIWDSFTYVVPGSVYNIYQIPPSSRANTSQGVIEWEGQSFDTTDLDTFGQQMGVDPLDNPTNAHIIGPNDPSTPGDESTLDIQWIAATGIGATNWFWIEGGTSWLYGFTVHFMNTQDVPSVISISYGWSEEDQCEQGIGASECSQLGVNSTAYVARVNTEFQKIGLRGISIFASSGDSGANGRTDEACSDKQFHPAFPAASPFLTAVGATRLIDVSTTLSNPPPICASAEYWWCASAGTEVAVSYGVSGFTSGGGFSNVAPMPDWQKAAVSKYLSGPEGQQLPAGYFNPNGRAYPDVSALGDKILIWLGSDQSIGGTSASCPMVAGIFSLLNSYTVSKTGKTLGPVNQLIYKMAQEQPATFTDITVGDNECTESGCGLDSCYGYFCSTGWDPVTGWGTPNYTQMLAYLQKFFESK